MIDKDGSRKCDCCGAVLTPENNTCGYEICDSCNQALEDAVKNIKKQD